MLTFKDITLDSIKDIRPLLSQQTYRTCDYTIGGILMWSSYFNYKYCIYNDMLYIWGKKAKDSDGKSFAFPVGNRDVRESVILLREYCLEKNLPLTFSAVPENAIPILESIFKIKKERLDNWADYFYLGDDLSTYKGRRYNKKRNHVNRFVKTYPNFKYERINETNIEKVKDFFKLFQYQVNKDSAIFKNEEEMVQVVLKNYSLFDFTGGVLEVEGKIIAFTMGEVVNDTLFIHIEKALREYEGVYETMSLYFAQDMVYDKIKYINREEDVGDEGLRKSKISYKPVALLNKYYVEVTELDAK